MTDNNTIVDIYVRLSDQDRDKINVGDESESIQNQKTMLINYCVERGWFINNIYCDEDYSGADINRPEWNKMIKDCELLIMDSELGHLCFNELENISYELKDFLSGFDDS